MPINVATNVVSPGPFFRFALCPILQALECGLLALLPVATATAGTSVVTNPIGAMNITIGPGNKLVGISLLNPAVIRSRVVAQTSEGVTLDVGGSNLASCLVSTSAYYVEITGGPNAAVVGERLEVNVAATIASASAAVFISPSSDRNTVDLSCSSVIGAQVAIRPHITIGQVFGTKGNTPMKGDTVVSMADQVLLLNSQTQAFETYYLLRNSTGTVEQWTKVGGGSANRDNQVIPPGVGMLVARVGASPVTLTVTGEVRTNAFSQPLVAGLNLVAEPFPLDHSPVERGVILDNGFVGSTTATTADQILVYANGKFDTYYLLKNSAGTIVQWTKIGGGSTNYNNADLFVADGAVLILKQDADPDYFVPLTFNPSI